MRSKSPQNLTPKMCFFGKIRQFDSYKYHTGHFSPLCRGGDLWAKFDTHMNRPHRVLGELGGVKPPPVPTPKWPFPAKTQLFDSLIQQMGLFFHTLMEGTCGQNLVPTWTIPTKFWGCWGVSNHPKYRHQNNNFWLILNWLTLTFNRLVNVFPCLMGGTCGQNLVATWTIPTKFWGCWGVSNNPW